jgi:hypothetical protein
MSAYTPAITTFGAASLGPGLAMSRRHGSANDAAVWHIMMLAAGTSRARLTIKFSPKVNCPKVTA